MNRKPLFTSFLLLAISQFLIGSSFGRAVETASESFRVSDQIPYGNLANPQLMEGTNTLDLGFMAHPHGGIEALWFCFRLEKTKDTPIEKVRIRLENLDTVLGGGNPEKMCPVYRVEGGEWKRMSPGKTLKQADGRRYAYWEIDPPETHLDVAACYPYGVPDVQRLVEESEGFYHLDEIGVSQQGRPIVRLSNDPGEPDGKRPGLYLMSRQHSGETPGSWVLDGMLRFFATRGDAAPLIWCTPLANIDGVENGDYGKDPFPHDLNRAWGQPPMRHEVIVLQDDARLWRKRCDPKLFLDLHAPGYSEDTGFYAFGYREDKLTPEQIPIQQSYNEVFEKALKHRNTESFLRYADYPKRWDPKDGSPIFSADYFLRKIGVMALSVECTYAFGGEKLYAIEDYREVGAEMGQAILEVLP
ncbi:MAG: hypothetical protein KC964_07215 [Candidatus Omnitrophica bacterium]|nr:hypothetical protein [Candidatus Omnitrophota bacterium]